MGALTEVLTERGASAQSFRDSTIPMFASHPSYKFTFVNHVTTNTFFTPTIYGLQDAATILGIPTPAWTGSINSLSTDMTTAISDAIVAKVDGIATCLIDPTAFNAPVENALAKGIPVIAYNADEPGNARMAYVGQNNITAGAAAAKQIVASGLVSKGDLVARVIATPGTGNIQPRVDGAKPFSRPQGTRRRKSARTPSRPKKSPCSSSGTWATRMSRPSTASTPVTRSLLPPSSGSTTSAARSAGPGGTSASPSSSRCKRRTCCSPSTSRLTCKASYRRSSCSCTTSRVD